MDARYPDRLGAVPLFGPIDERGIVTFEDTLGCRLPDDYRQFLLEWNGANFGTLPNADDVVVFAAQEIEGHTAAALRRQDWPAQTVGWPGTIWQVSWLNGIAPYDRLMTLSRDDPGYGFEYWAPPRFLAIGFSSYEKGHVCLSLSGHDRGEIYIWRWPEDPPLESEVLPNMRCMWWVAPSFRDFWNVLIPISNEEMIAKWK
jgi:hypothetical protein